MTNTNGNMKTAIIGCGAMGSVYAGKLAAAGNDVLAISRRTDHVDAINQHGLHLSWPEGEQRITLRASTQIPAEKMGMVVLAVKAADVADAARSCLALIDDTTLVLTIQNGLGSADQVADIVGATRLAVGVAKGFGASLPEAGHVHYNAMRQLCFGAYDKYSTGAITHLVKTWQAAGFNVEEAADIAVVQWEKLICNVAYSGPCALTGMTVGEVLEDTELGPISVAAATEAWRIARAKGIAIRVDDPARLARDFAAAMPDAKPSTLLDHEAHRVSEIDVINGAVPREAAKLGLEAPVNATITALVKAQERHWH
jgi:2-dehydropantoate 2-reductase